ncbi:MAG: universal stress protein [Anaerolineae bacterium]|nr:universal stress protein [Anaerolineae bacterium]
MLNPDRLRHEAAINDFKRARKKAAFQQMMARLRGQSADLLAYEDVCRHLKAADAVKQGVQEIPLAAIVGSVGRYKDFTRDFLPKHDSDVERWARVRTAVMDMTGMPPIDVYKVGEVYFVIDGNHRVSVARDLGAKTITAYVTEVKTRVPLLPDDDPDEIICKARYAEFLEQTNLNELRPQADLYMTFCGHYRVLLAQIEAHKEQCETPVGHPIPYAEAVGRWYDDVYLPVMRMMRAQGILRYFPERTETDLYVLLSERQEQLEEALGWEIGLDITASALATAEQKRVRGLGGRLWQAITPPELADGPEPGQWRQFQTGRQMDRLFADYLVALSGREENWPMLAQVIRLAQRESDRLLGLHVVPDQAKASSKRVRAIEERFHQMCADAGVVGEFAVEVGAVVETITSRAVWADVVVLGLENRVGAARPSTRLGNRTMQLIQRCPRPILAIPTGADCALDRVLLAYDGSPKADEALFVATYLKLRWPSELVVVTVETELTTPAELGRAREYLADYGITDATFILRQKPIAKAVLDTAVTYQSNFLIMGGFGFRPVKHLVLGSTVDDVLRHFPHPILICR